MKTRKDALIISLFMVGIFSTSPVLAVKMSTETQDLVIQKMERVLSTMNKKDEAWLSSQQRLADLLSERARTRFMAEVEANCEFCKGSKDDRLKAVQIYENLLKEVPLNEHSFILFQLAHLHEMAGQPEKAVSLYEQIISTGKKQKIHPAIITRSHASLGDLLYQKGKFAEAKYHYTVALSDPNLENKALTIYNLAWCDFNLENLVPAIKAIENLVKEPKKIIRETEEGTQYDAAFHTDLVRDLGTFYARKEITQKEIQNYYSYSPKNQRKHLLFSFAKEADRVGQKQAAQSILNKYLSDSNLTKEERLEATVFLAQVSYDKGETSASIDAFAQAATAIMKDGCSDQEKCEQYQKSMKHYVTELHRSQKLKPTQDLLNAYLTYNRAFPQDKDMTQRGAQTALDLKRYAVAISLYRSISENKKFEQKERMEALLNEVGVAEQSKDLGLQKAAYKHYIEYAPKNEKSFEMEYQLAYLNYQDKNYKDSSKDFEKLANKSHGSKELRKKAADLSLDSLAQLKNEDELESLSWDYSKEFPENEKEYSAIARRTLMNKVARIANDPKSEKTDLKKALKSLDEEKAKNASPEEKHLFYKNKSILALKLNERELYVESMTALMNLPNLTVQQKHDYQVQLAAFYEKRLQFKEAYFTALKLQNSKLPTVERQYRLAVLADIAGLEASGHYRKALEAGLSGSRALVAHEQIVLNSKDPATELRDHLPVLKKQPKLLNEIVLTIYSKNGNSGQLKSYLELKELRNLSSAKFIRAQSLQSQIESYSEKISNHELKTSNDIQLAKTISERVQLLKGLDQKLSESLALQDITSQLKTLHHIQIENSRLVENLAATPMPQGLSALEKAQYVNILKNQSRPFLLKAKMAERKIAESWNHATAIQNMIRDHDSARPEIRNLIENDLKDLSKIPGDGPLKKALKKELDKNFATVRQLKYARESVSEHPADIREIEKLKTIETQIGHPLMPSYLEERIQQIKRGKSL